MAFSPRGDLLATNAPKQIRIWRTGTWDLVKTLTLAGNVMVLKFSPDGTRLAGLSLPDELTVWEVNQWTVVRQFSVSLGWARLGNLDFSPDGKALVIGDADGRLRVIDLASENTILDRWEAHSEGITSVAWSPNGSVIASGSGWDGGPIKLWDATSGELLGELEGHTSWISDMAFSKDGLWLYSASGDQTLRIWDVEKQPCLATLRGSSHEVLGLALSPDGTTLASACKDGIVAFWSADPKPEEEMPRLIPLGHIARPVFAPDSRVLAVPRAGTVSLFDLATSKETELSELGDDVSAVAYSPDGTLLVSGSENGGIRVWSFAERRLLRDLDGHEEEIRLLRFRVDGARLLSIDAKRTVIWWDVPTWRQAGRPFVVELPGRPDDVWRPPDVSPDGRLLVFGTKAGDVCWLDAETGELLERTTGGDYATKQVAFSGDGSQLASTSNHGTVALWDPSSFTRVTSFRAHLTAAHGVTFSPHDRRLATGGATSRDAVRLWDLSTHRELITLPGQAAVSSFVVFSNDGRWLAACSGVEGKLHLWRAPSWDEIEAEEKRLKSKQCP
ncbi:MAG: WD40 repeat domain-containing protein [Phycisphaerae bacterium]|nr:WD40 repeat domain-containing protein [Phycisphaerae bacterium]